MNGLLAETIKIYGIKNKDLASLAGVSPSYITEIRKGRANPTGEIIEKLLGAMETLAPGARRYFCDRLAEESPSAPPTREATEGRLKGLIKEISSLPTSDIALVSLIASRNLVKSLKKHDEAEDETMHRNYKLNSHQVLKLRQLASISEAVKEALPPDLQGILLYPQEGDCELKIRISWNRLEKIAEVCPRILNWNGLELTPTFGNGTYRGQVDEFLNSLLNGHAHEYPEVRH